MPVALSEKRLAMPVALCEDSRCCAATAATTARIHRASAGILHLGAASGSAGYSSREGRLGLSKRVNELY